MPFGTRIVASTLTDRITAVRGTVRDGVKRAKEVLGDAQREAERALSELGLPDRKSRVIDVGATPSLASRVRRAALATLAFSMLAGGLLTLFLFLLQLGAAAFIVTRGLGLRLDVGPPRAAS